MWCEWGILHPAQVQLAEAQTPELLAGSVLCPPPASHCSVRAPGSGSPHCHIFLFIFPGEGGAEQRALRICLLFPPCFYLLMASFLPCAATMPQAPSVLQQQGFFCALSLHTSLLLSPSETSPGLLVAACSTGESWLMNLLSVAAVLARNKLLLT